MEKVESRRPRCLSGFRPLGVFDFAQQEAEEGGRNRRQKTGVRRHYAESRMVKVESRSWEISPRDEKDGWQRTDPASPRPSGLAAWAMPRQVGLSEIKLGEVGWFIL